MWGADQSSRSRTQVKKRVLVALICNLSVAEAVTVGRWGSLASLPSLFETSGVEEVKRISQQRLLPLSTHQQDFQVRDRITEEAKVAKDKNH